MTLIMRRRPCPLLYTLTAVQRIWSDGRYLRVQYGHPLVQWTYPLHTIAELQLSEP
jgi:hypothetical protein